MSTLNRRNELSSILKISAEAYIIQRPFLRGLSTEGNCISKSIGLASKFTVFALFTLYLKAIFQVQAPKSFWWHRFQFWGETKPPTPVLLNIHFSAALKVLVLGNLFKLLRLVTTFSRKVCHLEIKRKKILTIVVFFSLSPMATCPCDCDGKSNKLE